MNSIRKYSDLISCLNLFAISLIYINSYFSKNNHHAFSVDTIFLVFSLFLLVISLILKRNKSLFTNILSIIFSIMMNYYNISISYQDWIDREQPSAFTK